MSRLPIPNIMENLFDVTDKVVAITGAGQGIGRTLAQGFASAGSKVVMVDMNADMLAESKKMLDDMGATSEAVATDVSADDAPKKIVEACMDIGGRVTA